ncbi:MAG: DNA-directed RNA polymerase subunit H [archaeon]|nr:DNA-directed RNA polymerase subunit H [archaeon]
MVAEEISYNILEHELVPAHVLLSEEDAEKMLTKKKILAENLPKIKRSDAAVKILENVIGEPIKTGRIIKITRKSATAEEFVAYRLVTEK